MRERLRLTIIVIGVSLVWYFMIGRNVDSSAKRYPPAETPVQAPE